MNRLLLGAAFAVTRTSEAMQRATHVMERHADLVARRDEVRDPPLCHPPPLAFVPAPRPTTLVFESIVNV
jgi:hypothetical protein